MRKQKATWHMLGRRHVSSLLYSFGLGGNTLLTHGNFPCPFGLQDCRLESDCDGGATWHNAGKAPCSSLFDTYASMGTWGTNAPVMNLFLTT
ncbi:hypothetical protein B0O80DRAFT_475680, partial [Mortierella sp. GBAus27b]